MPISLRPLLRALLLSLPLAFAAAADGPAPGVAIEPGEEIVATWRGGAVDRATFDSWLEHARPAGSERTRQRRPTATDDQLLRRLILTLELADAARRRGVGDELAVVLARVESAALAAAYWAHVGAQVRVDPREVDRALRDHPAAFDLPRRVRLRNLFKRFSEGATAGDKTALRARMAQLRREAKGGADFAALARRESQSETRVRGGLMPVVAAGELRGDFDRVAMTLEPGQLSEVIETADGLTLLYLEEVLPAVTVDEGERRERLRSNLRRQRRKARLAAERQRLLNAAAPRYDLDAAVDPAAPGEREVLRFDVGGAVGEADDDGDGAGAERLRVRDLDRLRSQSASTKTRGEVSREGWRRRLEGHVLQTLAAHEAARLGLVDDSKRRAVRWRQLEILSADEIGHRVRARFEKPSLEDVRRAFGAGDAGLRPPHYDLELLRLPFEESGDDLTSTFETARGLAARLRTGELDFAAAARRHSDHPSAPDGGAVGWLSRPQAASLGPDLHRTLLGMSPGQVSDPVREGGAWWLLTVRGVEPARPLSFEEARPALEQRLAEERLEALQAAVLRELSAQLGIRLRP